MSQTFHVVQCYSCAAFQSSQVRKDKKFQCKICGAKQSVKKEYGRGSGKDCRVHVQKLNSLRGHLEEEQLSCQITQILEEDEEDQYTDEESGAFFISTHEGYSLEDTQPAGMPHVGKQESKWSRYMSSDSGDSSRDDFVPKNNFTSTLRNMARTQRKSQGSEKQARQECISERNQQSSPRIPARCHQSSGAEKLRRGHHYSGPYSRSMTELQKKSECISYMTNANSEVGERLRTDLYQVDNADEIEVADDKFRSGGKLKYTEYGLPNRNKYSSPANVSQPKIERISYISETPKNCSSDDVGLHRLGQSNSGGTEKQMSETFVQPHGVQSQCTSEISNSKLKKEDTVITGNFYYNYEDSQKGKCRRLVTDTFDLPGNTSQYFQEEPDQPNCTGSLDMGNITGKVCRYQAGQRLKLESQSHHNLAVLHFSKSKSHEKSNIEATYKKYEVADDFDDICDLDI